jgi:chlorite dismutase
VRVPGERKRFLVVYPFIKTHDWYQLSPDDRRDLMKDHARVGHSFKEIEQLLVYCTGIADWEFVVGYETNDLLHFSELVMALRSTAGRPYTHRDTPIFTGRYGSLEDVLQEAFGEEA